MENSLLLIVDMQNGFVFDRTEHIVPNILKLISAYQNKKLPIVFTRFLNYKGSAYENWIKWSRFMESPEIDLIEVFKPYAEKVIDKRGCYTAFTSEFDAFLKEKKIKTLVICGVATDGCVLKTAVDAFEKEIRPIVISNASASHAGENIHNTGLNLITRFIGKEQVLLTEDILKKI